MGRELQKKKNRSGNSKIKLKPKSKRINPLGNAIIAANWRQDETLTQNYRRLGLTSRLNTVTGGIEKKQAGPESKTSTTSKLSISNTIPKTFTPTEARVVRDPETGKIIRVIHDNKKENPLNDPLNSDDEDGEGFEGFGNEGSASGNDIVKMLEEQASRAGEKRERKQSEREKEWIENLVKKWGENYGSMVRDRRLNPMQQTEADIRRRVQKWKEAGGAVIIEA
ncbi:putative Nucleolar protein 16 [Sclerotinia borealis F-4128]|uniref:Nucleolar protein 16 n=1 Tax=Sclerotinia borealis (strain F-4128) TaxID=1432307 RepID=W9CN86_SCLBF|nr:putative Nucleolar protein 16 [Sclerotinia borealis F-4128]